MPRRASICATSGRVAPKRELFNLPRDVVVAPDGLIYITDSGNFRIQAFTQDGEPARAWGEPGKHLGQFTRPKGMSVDAEGKIYAVDAAFGNFQIFNPKGELLLFIGARSTSQGPAQYMLPAGITVDEDGRIYVIDQYFRKLDIYRPATGGKDEGYVAGAPRPETAYPATAQVESEGASQAESPAEAQSEVEAQPESQTAPQPDPRTEIQPEPKS